MSYNAPSNYASVLNVLKEIIRQSRTRAALSVNSALLATYWQIGHTILEQQKEERWGSKVIDTLSLDLRLEFPQMKGFSIRNLNYMRAFAEAYPDFPNVQSVLAQSSSKDLIANNAIMQVPLAQLSWYHHITLLTKVKDPKTRIFYVAKAIENGWSRDVMVHQLESGLHARQGSLITNFKTTVPSTESEALQQIFKDPYYFDFLHLSEEARERDLEEALSQHVTKLLLELGVGFAFKGRQYRLEADDKEYFLDLLFYHTSLRRHVVIELKIGDFKPEYAGKMNFYLGLVDDKLKGGYDEPSIGLILCKTKSKIIAEYALRDTSKPIGIAEYRIAERLPEDIKGELPSIEELEERLDEGLNEKLSASETRLKAIKEKLKSIEGDEIQGPLTFPILKDIYAGSLRPLYQQLIENFSKFNDLFYTQQYSWSWNNKKITNFEQLDELFRNEAQAMESVWLYFSFSYSGFRKDGTNGHVITRDIKLQFHDHWYGIELIKFNKPILKKLYHQLVTSKEREVFVETVNIGIVDEIEGVVEMMKIKEK